MDCYFNGPCTHSPDDCKYAALVQGLYDEFGTKIVTYGERIAEISQESESMNPLWDDETYRAVQVYRSEANKYQQLKMRPKNDG